MSDLTIIIPFYNGHGVIGDLVKTIPTDAPVVIVDDHSRPALSADDLPPHPNLEVIRPAEKGYFSGAVNAGIAHTDGDVLVLNQDSLLEGNAWRVAIEDRRREYALIGDGVMGHPAWPRGYVQGTFMFMRRDAIDDVGLLAADYYPLWGSTCEWQLRACRAGYKAAPLKPVPGYRHLRGEGEQFGSSIQQVLRDEPEERRRFVQTPPKVSVIISCYNYGRYLTDAVNSLIGGATSLGNMPGQTFQSFEVIVVNDASQDETREVGMALADEWQGIRYVELQPSGHPDGLPNNGTPAANNAGIEAAYGRYISILCADDMMEPWRLEQMVKALDANPHSVIYDGTIRFAYGERVETHQLLPYDFDRLIHQNHIHAGVMFPRRAWEETGGYPEAMRYGREDWAFNVALGIKGYCGIRLDKPGYLYRREDQGRSTRNTTPQWRTRFMQQMQRLFPTIYAGERPMGCCGERIKKRTVTTRSNGGYSSMSLTGKYGMTLVEYVGGNTGTQMWQGIETKQYYTFSADPKHKIKYVDDRDVAGFLNNYWEGDRPLFRVVEVDDTAELQVESGEAETVNPAKSETPVVEETMETPEEKTGGELSVANPNDMRVKDLEAYLASNDLSTTELRRMLALEQEGKNRTTAVDDLEAALEAMDAAD